MKYINVHFKTMQLTIVMLSLLIVIIVVSSLFLTGCSSAGNTDNTQQQVSQALPVIAVESNVATDTSRFTGSIEGISNVVILPQITGYLKSIHIDEGQFVQKGQLLFRIDDRPYKEQLVNAKAALQAAQASLLTADINVEKQEPLVESKVVSEINLKIAKANKASAMAIVAQAEAAVASAAINLDYCTIKAPVSGYIGSIPNKLGSLVSPQSTEPLTNLSDVSSVYVYFSMGENEFNKFHNSFKGATIEQKIKNTPPVMLELSDKAIFKNPGKIEIVEGQFDKNTASISFRARFPNPGALLRTGNTGVVLLPRNQANATLIPIASTSDLQDKIYVWQVDHQNKVHQVILTILGKSGINYIVSGINSGDKIVASGFDKLIEGATITPKK